MGLLSDRFDVHFAFFYELVYSADDEGEVPWIVDVAREEEHMNAEFPRAEPATCAGVNNDVPYEFTGSTILFFLIFIGYFCS